MRCLTRMGLGLAGLALVSLAPSAARADSGPSDAPARPRRSLFHKPQLCAQCQWAELRAKGINVPPPPLLPQGMATPGNQCDRCGAAVGTDSAVLGAPAWTSVAPTPAAAAPAWAATLPAAPTVAAVPVSNCVQCAAADANPPGRAVAGGNVAGGGNVPGHMIVGGTVPIAEPEPVGMIQGRYAYQYPNAPMTGAMAAAPAAPTRGRGRSAKTQKAGANDPAVTQSSFSNDPYLPDDHNRPHILSHLFGLDAIGRHSREEHERREREKHASIRYQTKDQVVNELPASMVYGR